MLPPLLKKYEVRTTKYEQNSRIRTSYFVVRTLLYEASAEAVKGRRTGRPVRDEW